MKVNTLKSSDEELVNHLVAVGIGNGIDRPQITLWDAESQAKYSIYPKKWNLTLHLMMCSLLKHRVI